MEMRFEKKEFEVQYDSDLVKPARMLEVIREIGFNPSLLVPVTIGENTVPDTTELTALLSRIVQDGKVDYAGLERERAILDRYLANVSSANLSKADNQTLLAFYINAYNAATLSLVLKYVRGKGPEGTDLESVLDVEDFFKKREVQVGNRLLSLDELEGLGRKLGDPRVHFAVNCASISCPVLLDHAWTAETLNQDLEAATRSYFATEHGLQIRDGRIYVSSLLDWYKDDFGGEEGLRTFLLRHAPKAAREFLDKGISFLVYDWQLNKQR